MDSYTEEDEDGDTHIIPPNDLYAHVACPECWCCPTDRGGVWIHHPFEIESIVTLH